MDFKKYSKMPKAKTVLIDLWNGKISLPITFWFFNVFITYILFSSSNKIVLLIYRYINDTDNIWRPGWLDFIQLILWFITFSWLLFSATGLWRCAKQYERSKLIKNLSLIASLFFYTCVIAVFLMLFMYIFVAIFSGLLNFIY